VHRNRLHISNIKYFLLSNKRICIYLYNIYVWLLFSISFHVPFFHFQNWTHKQLFFNVIFNLAIIIDN